MAGAAYAGLKPFCQRPDISPKVKRRVYYASVLSVLLYCCETWRLSAEDVLRSNIFGQRYLCRINRSDHVTNLQVGNRGRGSDTILLQCTKLSKTRWLGNMLCMMNTRLAYNDLFSILPT